MSEKVLRFGRFELDRENFELRRDGKAVKIERSPLELLLVLAERAGNLVTQEEAIALVWGIDVHIEAGAALYTAVRKIRRALGDTSKKPKYLETVPRKGYRFIAQYEHAIGKGSEAKEEGRPVLAVLPLENMSGEEEQEYFSDGMTEELITELGQTCSHELGVIARTSVMGYKRTQKDIREIGQELGADYLIEGSVRREKGRVRIAVQLIRTRDGSHLWAKAFEKPLREVFRAQSEVAQAVTSEIRVRLVNPGRPRKEVDAEAYDLYLRGRFAQAMVVFPALKKAIEYFEKVLERQPNFAPAWVGLAECYVRLPITSDVRPKEAFPRALEAAERAIASDPSLGDGYGARGAVRFWHGWDWKGVEADTREALARNPSNATSHLWRAHLHSNIGRHEEAIAGILRAKQLDPFSRIISTLHGQFHYHAGKTHYGEAQSLLRYALQIDPHFWVAHVDFSKIWGMEAEYGKAIAAAHRGFRYSHGNTEASALGGWAMAKGGRKAEARRELKTLEKLGKRNFIPPLHRAMIQVGLGEKSGALDALEEALGERDVRLTFLLVEPRWDPLRGDARFEKIVANLNFPAN
jgi:adenylate cyclase